MAPSSTPKIRPSLTPGTVCILLAGRYAGKRVIFLQQLPSGLILVSGPRKINGVPLKRVSQKYVIATSTKVDMSKVTLPQGLTEKALLKPKAAKAAKKGDAAAMFAEKAAPVEVSAERKALQADVDSRLMPAIEAVPMLRSYLKATFSLRKGQAPHALKW